MAKNEKTAKKKPYKSLASNMWWSTKKQIKYVPSLLVMMVLQTPVNVALAYAGILLPALVVEEVTAKQTAEHAILRVGILLALMLAGHLLQNIFQIVKQQKIGAMRWRCSEDLCRKSLGCFYQTYESKKMRDLLGRATEATEMWNGRQPISDMPRQMWGLIENILKYFLFGTVVTFVSPWLLPILTAAPLIQYFCNKAYRNWEYKSREERSDLDRKAWHLSQVSGDFGYAKDIRIYGLAEWLCESYEGICKKRHSWDKKMAKRSFLSRLADLFFILLRDGAAYAILIAMLRRGEITVDKFVLYFAAVSSFAGLIGGIVSTWNGLHATSLSLSDYREYMDTPEYEGSGTVKVDALLDEALEIRFDHVSFRYEGAEKDTIHDLSFTVRKGEKLALVGLNGAGKTTLVKLLCGLYLPTEGAIYIGGIPTSGFCRKDYYRLFSPVFQTIKLPFFSLCEIVSGREEKDTDFARAEHCMLDAGLGDKLKSLPRGIHTKLDKQLHKDGTELSGGEAQKLMLARALYKNAPILVLDEPTAALDPLAENHIYEEYNCFAKDKTSLFISHRLASTRFCDRIFYLENGVIAEEGTHESLVRLGGKYAELYEMQSCWYREEGGKQ